MSWKRITLVIFFLIGSVGYFGYWATSQFNHALDSLSSSNLAYTQAAYISVKRGVQLASTSPAVSEEISEEMATSTNPELSFTFPQKSGAQIYTGCTYPISWEATSTVGLLEAVLIDAGTRESMGPVASGIAEESVIEKGSKILDWKVGVVWPGAYYIKVSKINGVEAEFRSKAFKITNMPTNISTDEQVDLCIVSGGLL